MAQHTVVTLIDDLDGKTEADETVKFGLDGRDYEIDLAGPNAERLREALKAFVDSARRPSARRATPTRGGQDRDTARAIREWALKHGYVLSDRGRIPATVIADFEAGKPNPQTTAPEVVVFEEPDPVPATPWKDLTDERKTEVKAWSAHIGIEPKKWTRNAVARDEMSGYCQNDDRDGAIAYINVL